MTRWEIETAPRPRMAAVGARTERTSAPMCLAAPAVVLSVVTAALVLPVFFPVHAGKERRLPPDGVITSVKIEGLVSLTQEQVRAKLLSKAGAALDSQLIGADITSLHATKWFTEQIKVYYEPDPKDASGKGYILIFTVKEAPVLRDVEFRGMTKLKLKDVEESTGLKKGARADAHSTYMAVGQIKRLYEEKGYELAEVTLVEGGKTGDTRVVFEIFEGPQHVVKSIEFKGNTFVTDAVLRTKIVSRTRLLGVIGGKYHRDNLEEDKRRLKDYYQQQGFAEVQVTPVTSTGANLGDVLLTFVISEGIRYRVRNITFEGNKKIPSAKLREGLELHSGQPFLESVKEADRRNLIAKYNELGCIRTQILPEPRYTDEPGVVDLVYRIEEGDPYRTGEIKIRGNERTKDKVIRREAVMAGVMPGEPLNGNRLDLFKRRLSYTGLFVTGAGPGQPPGPGQGKPIDIRIINERPYDQPYGEGTIPDLNGLGLTRMQDPGPGPAFPPGEVVNVPAIPGPSGLEAPSIQPAPPGGAVAPAPFGAPDDPFRPPVDTPAIPAPVPNLPPFLPGRGPRPSAPPLGAGEPLGSIPSVPGMNANDVGPDRQDPFPNRSYADVLAMVEERPTGGLSFGVGASSYQGVYGNFIINESNFDIFNIPQSWNDIFSGNAFRGGGQQLSVNLMPGTLINKFMVTFREPYLFNFPINMTNSAYIFNRVYPDWTESRAGGRFTLGGLLGTQTYADVALRAEAVDFYGFTGPAPPDYLAAQGHTFLGSVRPSIRFDNRNNPLAPNKGQYLEFDFEEGFGSFTYPKFEVEGRSYFPTGSRPDGSGKRFITVRGHFGISGRDTPVYERFLAGNFGSLRGFQYRGVGPFDLGKNVGGIMEALGSVEYQFPWNASDTFSQVFFCDFGTVEGDYRFGNFRVSVGTGLRVVIPALGSLPFCFDLAFPISKAEGDRVQYFNFSVGTQFY